MADIIPTHAIVPIEPTELDLARLAQTVRAMRRLKDGYTLIDYARSLWEAMLEPYASPPIKPARSASDPERR